MRELILDPGTYQRILLVALVARLNACAGELKLSLQCTKVGKSANEKNIMIVAPRCMWW